MPLKNREKPDRRSYVDMPYDARDKDAEMRAATSYVPRKSSRNGATVFNITVFLLVFGVVLLAARAVAGAWAFLRYRSHSFARCLPSRRYISRFRGSA